MHLLGSLDRARREEVDRLLATNNRLRWENRRYSLDIVSRDRRIEELEHRLGSAADSNSTAPIA
jgi:anti-sigma factor RsiW